MQPADYRLVRSHIKSGIMIATKRTVFPQSIDQYFSSWLYGQTNPIDQISIHLPRSMSCLVCSDNNVKYEEFSLLTVDINLFLRCLPLLNNKQLSILYSLLDDDQQSYKEAIQQQYQRYKQQLIQVLKRKSYEQYYRV